GKLCGGARACPPGSEAVPLRGGVAGVAAALTMLIVASACSGSGGLAASTPTSAPCSSSSAAPPSATPVTTVVPVDGSGERNVGLPANLSLPLIVHAHREGSGTFIVRGIDASGKDTQVLASALGAYD